MIIYGKGDVVMKRKSMKVLCLVIAVAITVAIVPKFSIDSFATSKGSKSCSASNHDNMAKVSLSLVNANSSTSDTATYIVDKYLYPDMASFGKVYSATFEGTGMYASSSITTSGAYSVSNPAIRNDQLINAYSNTLFSVTDTGTFVGAVPEPGTSVSLKITANMTSKWNIPGVLNGLAVFQNSPSVSLNAVVIGVDSTALQNEILRDSALSSSCWTAETWASFADALASAKSVSNSTTALQPEIDAAADSLIAARQDLIHNGSIANCEYCLGANEGLENERVESLYDVSYGNSNMDVFMPANCEGDVSLIVFIHGGAWISGDKSEFSGRAYDACAKYGIVAATVNYRYADCFNVTGWSELDDIQNAVAKIKSMAAERGLNVVKMMTAGHSAGGHLSLMYAYTKKDTSPVKPVCVWDMSGPAALYNPEYLHDGLEKALSAVSGVYFTTDQAQLAYPALLNMSPVNYTTSDTVPTLICHGTKDQIVPYSDSVALNYNLDQAGVEHTFITFPNSNHGLESDPDCYNQMMSEYDRYVRTYLLPGGVPSVVHRYISETVTGMSCASPSYTFHSCKDCGKYYITDIEEIPHTPGEWRVVTAPTDSTDGLEAVECTVCGQIIDSKVIPKLVSTDESGIVIAPESNILLEETDGILYGFDSGFNYESIAEYISAADINAQIEVVPTQNGYGTGTQVNVIKDGGVVESYTVIIFGDTTGDAVIDESDFVMIDLFNAMLNMPEEDDPRFKGMDCNRDGAVDESDVVLADLVNAFLGEIDQVNGGIILF